MFPPSAPSPYLLAEVGPPKTACEPSLCGESQTVRGEPMPSPRYPKIGDGEAKVACHLHGPAAYQHVRGTTRPRIAASWPPTRVRWLAAQSQLFDQDTIALRAGLLQVAEHAPPLADHHAEAAQRVIVVLVL